MRITIQMIKKQARESGVVQVDLYSGAKIDCRHENGKYYWWTNRVFQKQCAGRVGDELAADFINYYGASSQEKAIEDAQYANISAAVWEA